MNPLHARIMSLITSKPRDFHELLALTWGISPADLKGALDALQSEGHVRYTGDLIEPKEYSERGILSSDSNIPSKRSYSIADREVSEFVSRLPLPHAHDFDWRFTGEGMRAFAEHVVQYQKREDPVCVIAAPTIYAYLRFLGFFERLELVERSEDTVDTIRSFFGDSAGICSHDLQYPWPAWFVREFKSIIMDPPWYQDYYELFISRATELLSVGGFIHTAIFPPFAKSNALLERTSIISFAQNRGLFLIELKNGLLRYESPPFERQSFAVDGYECSEDWRKGDVASFFLGTKYGRENVYRVETGRWREFRIGKSKLKLRMDESGAYEAPMIEPVESDQPFLGNVSRKYPLRENISLWTSCQQAFRLQGSNVVAMLLECIEEGKNEESAIPEVARHFGLSLEAVRRDCATCYKTLIEIIRRERESQDGC